MLFLIYEIENRVRINLMSDRVKIYQDFGFFKPYLHISFSILFIHVNWNIDYSHKRPTGRFQADKKATPWPQMIIWDEDQKIRDVKLGPSVANKKYVKVDTIGDQIF